MSPHDRYHQREENPHQGASHSFGVPGRDEEDSADRERAIETGRDRLTERGGPLPPSESNVDRMFHDFGLARGWTPQIEAIRRDGRFIIRADLPGMRKEDVNVEIQDDVLSISGERRTESRETRGDVVRSERSYGRFYRAFSLPESVDTAQYDATFNNGVLEVSFGTRMPEQKRATRIPIR